MKTRARFQYTALGLIALMGCSKAEQSLAPQMTSLAMELPASQAPTQERGTPAASATPTSAAFPAKPGESQKQTATNRLLIYTATLQVRVTKPEDAVHFCQDLALKRGGYVLSRQGQAVQIRVPSAGFFDAVGEIEKLGKVNSHEVRAEDVSEQFRDLELRLKNAHAVRDRISQLLNRGVTIKDALAIESELARLSEEIEVMEGQLRRMKELTSYSTISASFDAQEVEHVASTPLTLPFAWLDRLSVQKLMEVKL